MSAPKPGERVLLFSQSGTFRGHPGRVTELAADGAWVRVEGESMPMRFKASEIVRELASHHGGAE